MERTLLETRPHWAFIVLRRLGLHTVLMALAIASFLAGDLVWNGATMGAGWLVLLGLALSWDALVWLSLRYVLTTERIRASGGVLRRWSVEARLDRLALLVVTRQIRERIFGLGTISCATRGTAWTEIHWRSVEGASAMLETIRAHGE